MILLGIKAVSILKPGFLVLYASTDADPLACTGSNGMQDDCQTYPNSQPPDLVKMLPFTNLSNAEMLKIDILSAPLTSTVMPSPTRILFNPV